MKNNMSEILKSSEEEVLLDELVGFYNPMNNHLKYVLLPDVQVVLVS